VGGVVFLGDVKASGLDILCGVDRSVTYKTEYYMEKPTLTEGVLIRRQSYHDDYACTLGRVIMLGGDGIDFCTRVPTARCAWGL
jgi:hypothetical protein